MAKSSIGHEYIEIRKSDYYSYGDHYYNGEFLNRWVKPIDKNWKYVGWAGMPKDEETYVPMTRSEIIKRDEGCGWPLCPMFRPSSPTFVCPTPIQGSPCEGMEIEV